MLEIVDPEMVLFFFVMGIFLGFLSGTALTFLILEKRGMLKDPEKKTDKRHHSVSSEFQ